jgi:hypothetical protein
VAAASFGGLAGLAMAGILGAGKADAHYTWYCDSVNGAAEIVFEDTTSFDTEFNHAIATWNGHNTISIFHDPGIWVSTTLELGDFYDPNGPAGQYVCYFGVKANTAKMNTANVSSNPDVRKKIATHEIGHALRLDHNDIAGDVMKQGLFALSPNTCLGDHTHADFHGYWGAGSAHNGGCGK